MPEVDWRSCICKPQYVNCQPKTYEAVRCCFMPLTTVRDIKEVVWTLVLCPVQGSVSFQETYACVLRCRLEWSTEL